MDGLRRLFDKLANEFIGTYKTVWGFSAFWPSIPVELLAVKRTVFLIKAVTCSQQGVVSLRPSCTWYSLAYDFLFSMRFHWSCWSAAAHLLALYTLE